MKIKDIEKTQEALKHVSKYFENTVKDISKRMKQWGDRPIT